MALDFRSFWSEPRPATPPLGSADWAWFAGVVAVALIEVLVRDDLGFGSTSFLLGLALTPTVLWRRLHPFAMTALGFGATAASELVGRFADWQEPEQNALVFLLLLPHALFRWGSGREALLGLPVIALSATLGFAGDDQQLGEVLGGLGILSAPIAIGVAGRYRDRARAQELADVRSGERLNLARELHDTVAHHVSAIAVRAQAGIATAPGDPEAAVDALRVIGEEASRTLAEMREMVRVLRTDEPATLAPAPKLADLERLAAGRPAGLAVELTIAGDRERVSPATSSALYRVTQESLTNSARHARGATRVSIEVDIGSLATRLTVRDDGQRPTAAHKGGYGLIGMAERAQLLGGSLTAGPGAERGWTVRADFPHDAPDPS
ncbi:MAG: sensor histidine kinase [Planctomycetota bacterium]